MTVELSRFTGRLDWVQIHLGEDGHELGIDPRSRHPRRHVAAVVRSQDWRSRAVLCPHNGNLSRNRQYGGDKRQEMMTK
jgi:hypothetical protein